MSVFKNIIMLSCLVVALASFTVAQERTTGSTNNNSGNSQAASMLNTYKAVMDAAINHITNLITNNTTQIVSNTTDIDDSNALLQAIALCNRQTMFYSPGHAQADANGCVHSFEGCENGGTDYNHGQTRTVSEYNPSRARSYLCGLERANERVTTYECNDGSWVMKSQTPWAYSGKCWTDGWVRDGSGNCGGGLQTGPFNDVRSMCASCGYGSKRFTCPAK